MARAPALCRGTWYTRIAYVCAFTLLQDKRVCIGMVSVPVQRGLAPHTHWVRTAAHLRLRPCQRPCSGFLMCFLANARQRFVSARPISTQPSALGNEAGMKMSETSVLGMCDNLMCNTGDIPSACISSGLYKRRPSTRSGENKCFKG